MMPVVTATTYGEREAMLVLTQAWEMLTGGIPYSGLSAYVENHVDFETNKNYSNVIEKKAEAYYRVINQKNNASCKQYPISKVYLRSNSIVMTPQESEQLSMYVSDDAYVKRNKRGHRGTY